MRADTGKGDRVWGQEEPRGGQGRAGLGSYWDVLFQPALWEDSIELGPERPLGQDGEHHTFEDQGIHALKEDGQPRGPSHEGPEANTGASALTSRHRPACSTARRRPRQAPAEPTSS